MLRLKFSSVLSLSYRDELERIVFFNPHQKRFIEPLLAAVNGYGVPIIVEEKEHDRLRLTVPAFPSSQTLYALEGPDTTALLAGVALFVREHPDTMLLLHLAVHPDYTDGGSKADEWVAARLIAAVRDICLRTKGVANLRLIYPREKTYVLR